MKHSRWIGALWTLCAALALAGCRPEEKITRYSVPKETRSPGKGTAAPAAIPEPGRMLGAIIPQGEQIWFVKLTGPKDDVSQRREEFANLLSSWSFENGQPQWKLPAGWTAEAGNQFRFATLKVAAAPKIDCSVTVLPAGDGDQDAYVLSNVNRWRGQLGLPEITKTQLLGDEAGQQGVMHAEIAGVTATVIDFEGMLAAAGTPRGPFSANQPPQRPVRPDPPAPPGPAGGLSYEQPGSWSPGQVGGMRKAAFNIKQGGESAEVTVIDLNAAANDLLGNVNRWRGQVGLPSVTAEALQEIVQKVPLADGDGDFVELAAPAEAEKQQTILGVIAVRGDKAWFIKMQGDSALAAAEKSRFLEFVKSVKLSPPEGNSDGQ